MLYNENYDTSKACRMFRFAKLHLNGRLKNICVGKFSNFRSRPSWKKSCLKLQLQKNNSPGFSQFSANNCEALLQTSPCVWPMLCSWPSGRSSLGLYMFSLQPQYYEMSSLFSECHIAAWRPIKAAADEMLASLYELLCRGVKYL